MSYCCFVASEEALFEGVFYGSNELEQKGIYVSEVLDSWIFTDKKYTMAFESEGTTKEDADLIVSYIENALKDREYVEFWSAFLSYTDYPKIRKKATRLSELTSEVIMDWCSKDVFEDQEPVGYGLTITKE